MINLKKINLTEFGNGIGGGIFMADTNFTLAAIVELTKNTTAIVNKDDIVDLTNHLQKKAIGTTTEPKTFDDIFIDLSNKGLIFTPRINLKELRVLLIADVLVDGGENQQLETASKRVEREILKQPMSFNQLRLTDMAVAAIKAKYKTIYN